MYEQFYSGAVTRIFWVLSGKNIRKEFANFRRFEAAAHTKV